MGIRLKFAKYRLIAANKTNLPKHTKSDSQSYILTYEKKVWYNFGKTKIIKKEIECPTFVVSYWLKDIENRIKLGEWR